MKNMIVSSHQKVVFALMIRFMNLKACEFLGLGGSMRYSGGKISVYRTWNEERVKKLWFQLLNTVVLTFWSHMLRAYQINDGRDLPHQGFQVFIELIE